MTPRRVVIIGAGFSGATLAGQILAQQSAHRCEITLIEQAKRFGPGLAYGAKEKRTLLNVRASNMSALAQAPDDFVRWLKLDGAQDPAEVFAPRHRYGAYLETVLKRAQRRARGHRLRCVRGEALACQPSQQGWRVELREGKPLEADAVVLALGNAPLSPPAALAGVAVASAFDLTALARIPGDADVLLVGAGLTMVDVALALSTGKTQGTIYALSRRGLTPRQQVAPSQAPPLRVGDLPAPLSQALHAFREEIAAMAARGEPWQWGMERLRAITPALWRRLTLEQQQRFLRHLRVWWDVHRHRLPSQPSNAIKALLKSGRLRLLAGEIVAAETRPRGVQIFHRQRGSYVRHRLEVAAVVNCTGAALDVGASQAPLLAQMREAGLVRPHPTGLGFDVAENGALIDRRGAPANTLFSLGPPTQGAFWECIAVPEIRAQAQNLAKLLTLES